MDDFNVSSLHESKNEWGSRLLTIMTPLVAEGLKSIFDEAVHLCKSNNEMDKYLMTFQNFISRIPKWNPNIIETEKNRIVERSGCGYLEDLVTCVHIIQLKLLTAIRVGQKQKKIDITIPKLDDFIHKIYINVARKIYKNVYLYELNIPPLQIQKHHRELEIIIQECILNAVRESIPVETILRAYMDETVEEDVIEEIKEELVAEEPVKADKTHIVSEINEPKLEPVEEKMVAEPVRNTLESQPPIKQQEEEIPEFPELGEDTSNTVSFVDVKQDYKSVNYDSDTDNESENMRLNILDKPITLDNFDVHVLDEPNVQLNNDFLLDDIEVLA